MKLRPSELAVSCWRRRLPPWGCLTANGLPTPQVTKAYRKLARKWHPDKNKGKEEVFASIARAYGVLTDPEKREIFDRLGEKGLDRLRDGDPSVKKDWLPDDEVRVLRLVAHPWCIGAHAVRSRPATLHGAHPRSAPSFAEALRL